MEDSTGAVGFTAVTTSSPSTANRAIEEGADTARLGLRTFEKISIKAKGCKGAVGFAAVGMNRRKD